MEVRKVGTWKMVIKLVLCVVGFIMLIKGADYFVDGASGIATKLGIPQLVIGLTVVAMGTSAPEAAVSFTAALEGSAEITIGNIVGSNILNILIILGITSLIIPVLVSKSTVRYEIPYMVFVTVMLLIFGYTGNIISTIEGIVLWITFILYLIYLLIMAKKGKTQDELPEEKSVIKLSIYILIGLVLIIYGSKITVNAATDIAKLVGLSERFIGLTIVALGTSLPELFTSVTAAIKGKADIAIGNIVGSNIFNILFVIGTTALIVPIPFAIEFRFDTIVAIATAILLLLCVVRKKKLGRVSGIFMLVLYIIYFVKIL